MLIEVNGTNLWYEKLGDGKPLILLHGNGGDSSVFNPVKDKLAENYSVYLIDLRGHGQSDKAEELNFETMTEDVKQFIEKLRLDLYDPILYGFDDGGIIGLMLAAKEPFMLSKLIVSGTDINPEMKGEKVLSKFGGLFKKNKKPSRVKIDGLDINEEDLRAIKIQVLIAGGENDSAKIEDLEFIANSIPNSRLKILPGETHDSYVVNSKKLIDVIIPFIRLLAFD